MSQHTVQKGWILSQSPDDGSMVPFFVNVRAKEIHMQQKNLGGWTTTRYKETIEATKREFATAFGLTYTKGHRYIKYVFFPFVMRNTNELNVNIVMNSVPNTSWEYANMSYSFIYNDSSREEVCGIRIIVTNIAEAIDPITASREDALDIRTAERTTIFDINLRGVPSRTFSFITTGYTLGEEYTSLGVSAYSWNAIIKERYYYIGMMDNKVAGITSYQLTDDVPVLNKGWESIRTEGQASAIEFYIDPIDNCYKFRLDHYIDDIDLIDYEEEKADPVLEGLGNGGESSGGVTPEELEAVRSEFADKIVIESRIRKSNDDELREMLENLAVTQEDLDNLRSELSSEFTDGLQTEENARVAGDAALSDSISNLSDRVGANESSIVALSGSISNNADNITALQGSLSDEANTRASEDTAIRNDLSSVSGRVSTNETSITALQGSLSDEASTRAAEDTAIRNLISRISGCVTVEEPDDESVNFIWYQITDEPSGDETALIITVPTKAEFDDLVARVTELDDRLVTEEGIRLSADTELGRRISNIITTDEEGNHEYSTWFQVVDDEEGGTEPSIDPGTGDIVINGITRAEFTELLEQVNTEREERMAEDININNRINEVGSVSVDGPTSDTTWYKIINEDSGEPAEIQDVIVISGVSREELDELKQRVSELDESLTVESGVRLTEDTKLANKDTELESMIASSTSNLQLGTDAPEGSTTWLQIVSHDGE